jgi:hypothetical protein
MSNESTKEQLHRFFENAIKRAKEPNSREKLKRIRRERAKKVSQKFGL